MDKALLDPGRASALFHYQLQVAYGRSGRGLDVDFASHCGADLYVYVLAFWAISRLPCYVCLGRVVHVPGEVDRQGAQVLFGVVSLR